MDSCKAELMSDKEYATYERDIYLDIKNNLEEVRKIKEIFYEIHPTARDVLLSLINRK